MSITPEELDRYLATMVRHGAVKLSFGDVIVELSPQLVAGAMAAAIAPPETPETDAEQCARIAREEEDLLFRSARQ